MPSHQDLADRLRAAYTGGAVPPLRDGLATDDAAGAYAVQALNTAHWQAEGRRLVGRKIGLTAKAVQAQLGVSQPDFGALFADMQIADSGMLDPARTLQPKVEAEVALVLARPLSDPQATIDDIIAATDHVVPALEIVDSRIADWKISFADTVADNGSSAYYVLGTEPRKLAGLDLYTCGMAMTVNGEIVSLGAGAACLGHPLNAALWLVRTLAAVGEGLQAGDVILTGALGPMVALKPGDVVEARVGGLGGCGFRMGDAA
ncbi:2-keto-4-pentenoate hydratase [Polymorphobacter sp.]|uniref:2-keto-4-pentenoate hydratase n=1 Tax=Polymorphobacter sp. TaxID=1909290 RepID=UPI003F704550